MSKIIKIEFSDEFEFFAAKKIVESTKTIKFSAFSPTPFSNSKRNSSKWYNGLSVWGVIGSFVGAFLTAYFIFWSSEVDYALNIGGKPMFSLVPSLPVIFEMSIFFAFIFIIIAFLLKLKLPKWKEENEDCAGRFILIIEFNDRISEVEILPLLMNSGGTLAD